MVAQKVATFYILTWISSNCVKVTYMYMYTSIIEINYYTSIYRSVGL